MPTDGFTPLMLASFCGGGLEAEVAEDEEGDDASAGIIGDLICQGASLGAQTDRTGETALHLAARYARADAAKRLLDAGADTNAQDNTGRTPLHAAVTADAQGVFQVRASGVAVGQRVLPWGIGHPPCLCNIFHGCGAPNVAMEPKVMSWNILHGHGAQGDAMEHLPWPWVMGHPPWAWDIFYGCGAPTWPWSRRRCHGATSMAMGHKVMSWSIFHGHGAQGDVMEHLPWPWVLGCCHGTSSMGTGHLPWLWSTQHGHGAQGDVMEQPPRPWGTKSCHGASSMAMEHPTWLWSPR